jgi:hypothetical protein
MWNWAWRWCCWCPLKKIQERDYDVVCCLMIAQESKLSLWRTKTHVDTQGTLTTSHSKKSQCSQFFSPSRSFQSFYWVDRHLIDQQFNMSFWRPGLMSRLVLGSTESLCNGFFSSFLSFVCVLALDFSWLSDLGANQQPRSLTNGVVAGRSTHRHVSELIVFIFYHDLSLWISFFQCALALQELISNSAPLILLSPTHVFLLLAWMIGHASIHKSLSAWDVVWMHYNTIRSTNDSSLHLC